MSKLRRKNYLLSIIEKELKRRLKGHKKIIVNYEHVKPEDILNIDVDNDYVDISCSSTALAIGIQRGHLYARFGDDEVDPIDILVDIKNPGNDLEELLDKIAKHLIRTQEFFDSLKNMKFQQHIHVILEKLFLTEYIDTTILNDKIIS